MATAHKSGAQKEVNVPLLSVSWQEGKKITINQTISLYGQQSEDG